MDTGITGGIGGMPGVGCIGGTTPSTGVTGGCESTAVCPNGFVSVVGCIG